MVYDVLIAGAGVIGGMVARELSRYNLQFCLLEKENDVACGASKANSDIVHGGFDPEPDTLKAELNVEGVPLLYEAAKQLHVPCINNGSIVCAFGREEEKTLNELATELNVSVGKVRYYLKKYGITTDSRDEIKVVKKYMNYHQ